MRVFGLFPFQSFICRCPRRHPTVISPDLVRIVMELIEVVGDIVVTSGHRCKEWNKKVGGTKNSRHITGEAIDLKVVGMTLGELREILEGINGVGGIGLYSEGFVHIDVRQKKARWGRENGRYCAIEEVDEETVMA